MSIIYKKIYMYFFDSHVHKYIYIINNLIIKFFKKNSIKYIRNIIGIIKIINIII